MKGDQRIVANGFCASAECPLQDPGCSIYHLHQVIVHGASDIKDKGQGDPSRIRAGLSQARGQQQPKPQEESCSVMHGPLCPCCCLEMWPPQTLCEIPFAKCSFSSISLPPPKNGLRLSPQLSHSRAKQDPTQRNQPVFSLAASRAEPPAALSSPGPFHSLPASPSQTSLKQTNQLPGLLC